MTDLDRLDDASLAEAAVDLGVSPTVLSRLLESGQLPWHLAPDGQHHRVARSALLSHRDARFALRQQMRQEQRNRRWPDPDHRFDDLDDLPTEQAR